MPDRLIGELLPSGQELTHIHSCCSLDADTLLMRKKDYSQLPVMSDEGWVEGIITRKSVGRRVFSGDPCRLVGDCRDTSLIRACFDNPLAHPSENIAKHGYVLVMEDDEMAMGIVTGSDLTTYFGKFAEGFLAIEEIEGRLARLMTIISPTNRRLVQVVDSIMVELGSPRGIPFVSLRIQSMRDQSIGNGSGWTPTMRNFWNNLG